MRNLAVFFDVFGAAMFGFLGPVFVGLGGWTDDGSILTAGIATTAVGGALLLAGIPLWLLWPGRAERIDSGAGVAIDRVGPWFAFGGSAPAAGLALGAHWAVR
ncbi:MAG: hypothetical protein JW895_18285 [Thermoleophilaceae bacterium]|nr:hypothetical protein [Thermoleophilaceae bacterium]